MKRRYRTMVLPLLAGCAAASTAPSACDAARGEIERHAVAQGLTAAVRCRVPEPVSTERPPAVAEPWPTWMHPRSGPLIWSVRELPQPGMPSSAGRLRRVPLAVIWTGPAWVSARALPSGSALQPDSVTLQQRRWPEGVEVQMATLDSPPSGRLRRPLNAGEMLLPTHLHPPGTVLRGDAVTAVVAEGAVEVRWPARMLATGVIGRMGVARLAGRGGAVQGRLLDTGTLRLEGL